MSSFPNDMRLALDLERARLKELGVQLSVHDGAIEQITLRVSCNDGRMGREHEMFHSEAKVDRIVFETARDPASVLQWHIEELVKGFDRYLTKETGLGLGAHANRRVKRIPGWEPMPWEVPFPTMELTRKQILEQVAEFVMDYGVPKNGADLQNLCEQIKTMRLTA